MEPTYIFCKELPVDENNIFTANITENMKLKMLSLINLLNMQL